MADTRHPHPQHKRVPCAVPQCNKSVPGTLVLCGTHWRKAPTQLRQSYFRHQSDARTEVEAWARGELAVKGEGA